MPAKAERGPEHLESVLKADIARWDPILKQAMAELKKAESNESNGIMGDRRLSCDNMYQKMRVGVVHFKAFPGLESGEGPLAETLEKICADDFWTAVEVGWMKDYRERNTCRCCSTRPSLGRLRDPAAHPRQQAQSELLRRQ